MSKNETLKKHLLNKFLA